MILPILAVSMIFAAGQHGEQGGQDPDRNSIRCRPAPFYVADRMERPKLERSTVTGSRVPNRAEEQRRARPCHLMQTPAPAPGFGFIRADE